MHLTEPPSLLIHPGVFLRTLASAFQGRPPSRQRDPEPRLDPV
jgi:hypothetical protein